MNEHFIEKTANYESHVIRGFHTLKSNIYSLDSSEDIRDFRTTIPDGEKNSIKTLLFGGFQKCLYPVQKFDSDSERRFSIILEDGPAIVKWLKPSRGDFQIHYSSTSSYEPDFVVETTDKKYLCEPKRASELTDETVLCKSQSCKNMV